MASALPSAGMHVGITCRGHHLPGAEFALSLLTSSLCFTANLSSSICEPNAAKQSQEVATHQFSKAGRREGPNFDASSCYEITARIWSIITPTNFITNTQKKKKELKDVMRRNSI